MFNYLELIVLMQGSFSYGNGRSILFTQNIYCLVLSWINDCKYEYDCNHCEYCGYAVACSKIRQFGETWREQSEQGSSPRARSWMPKGLADIDISSFNIGFQRLRSKKINGEQGLPKTRNNLSPNIPDWFLLLAQQCSLLLLATSQFRLMFTSPLSVPCPP